jgi:hypothetical protein
MTAIYRSQHSDRYLQRNRHGNGHELNTAPRRHDPNRLTPTYDTPTNLTPLSVTPFSATPTDPKSNPFCDSFQKALVQKLGKQTEASEVVSDMTIVVDTLKVALPPAQLHLSRDQSPRPHCPLIQVSTITTPPHEEGYDECDKYSHSYCEKNEQPFPDCISVGDSNDRQNEIISALASDSEPPEEAHEACNESQRILCKGDLESSVIEENGELQLEEEACEMTDDNFLVFQIVSDPPYRDDVTDLTEDESRVQKTTEVHFGNSP